MFRRLPLTGAPKESGRCGTLGCFDPPSALRDTHAWRHPGPGIAPFDEMLLVFCRLNSEGGVSWISEVGGGWLGWKLRGRGNSCAGSLPDGAPELPSLMIHYIGVRKDEIEARSFLMPQRFTYMGKLHRRELHASE